MTKILRAGELPTVPKGSAPVLIRRKVKQDVSMWKLLVWAYKAQLVHYGRTADDLSDDLENRNSGVDQIALLGVRVDGGGARNDDVGSFAHQDAFIVHELVEPLPSPVRRSLIKAANMDMLPDWAAPPPRARVAGIFRANGKPRMMKGDNFAVPNACKVQCLGYTKQERLEWTERHQSEYTELRKVIHRLALWFYANDVMKRYRVLGVGVEKEPWLSISK